MAGAKALRRLQLGLETTKGQALATTAIWRGMGTIEDRTETVFIEEDVGQLASTTRSYTSHEMAAITFESVPATFEQLPYVFSAGVKNVTTGAADGTGSGFVYTYTLPTTAQNTISTYTLEGGDDQQAEEMEYSFVESFALSGAMREAVNMSADWLGRQVTDTTFTTAPSLPTVEEIIFGKGKIYIDTSGGTFGGTVKSGTLIGFDLSWTTGFIPVFSADGNLYFATDKQVMPDISLDITFEHDSIATAEKTAWRAGNARLFRLLFEGSALTTADTYTYKTLQIDLAGKWSTFSKLADTDGNDIVTGTFVARYDETASDFGEIIVVNELASLP